MSDSMLIAIAEAVKDELNAAYAAQFTAIREYRPVFTLEELTTLRCTVVPRQESSQGPAADRGSDVFEYAVDVALQQKLADPADLAEKDALMFLAEQIGDLFRGKTMDPPDARCIRVGNEVGKKPENVPYLPDDLESRHVFSAVVTLFWQARRLRPR